jgi:hypothetical protein
MSTLIGLTSLAVLGCEGPGYQDTTSSRTPPPRDNGDVVISRAPARSDGGAYDRTSATRDSTYDRTSDRDIDHTADRADRASDRISDRDLRRDERLPTDAAQVGEKLKLDPDTGIYYKPDRDGRVYVYDNDSRSVVFSTHVNRRQKVWLNLDREKVTVDGRVVFEGNLPKGAPYELYFVPDVSR